MTELERQGELGPAAPPVGRPATRTERARRVAATVLSSIVPGAGHLLLRAWVRGALWFVLALAATYLWWGMRMPLTFGGLLLAALVNVALWFGSGADALLGMRKDMPRAHRGGLLGVALLAIVSSLVCSDLLGKAAGFHHFSAKSNAMELTIRQGEEVIFDTHAFRVTQPRPGDLVLIDRNGERMVRRVIAAGGATVQGKNGAVLLNGAVIPEPYASHTGPDMPNLDNFPAVTVPEGEYFVAGDNRDKSLDSRMPDFGLVTDQAVLGRPLYIVRSSSPVRIGRTLR